MFVRIPNFPNVAHNLPIGSRLSPFWELRKPWGLDQFKALPFGLSTAPFEFTVIPKEVKLMTIHKVLRSHQYLDDWLVRARSHQACLQHTQELVNNVSATRLAGELREIRTGAQTRLQFYRLPVRPQIRSGPADSSSVAEPSRENAETALPTGLPGPGIHVLDRFANSYRKASSSRPTSYETHSVASQTTGGSQNHWKRWSQSPGPCTPIYNEGWRKTMSLQSNHYTQKTCSANIYRRINRRVGRSLRWALCKSNLVPSGKQVAYKLSRTLSSFSDFKEFQDLCSNKIVLVATDNTTVVSYIKEGGMRSGPLCALLWRILTWCTRKQVTLKHDTFQAGLML